MLQLVIQVTVELFGVFFGFFLAVNYDMYDMQKLSF